MAWVLADNEDLTMAPDDFAFIAHLLDRRTYFHNTDPFSFLGNLMYMFTPQPQA